jgi:lipoprotein-anchoring transpeptidase ErfK/SrfK
MDSSSPSIRRLLKIGAPVLALLVVLAGAGIVYVSNSQSAREAASYHSKRAALDSQIKQARQQGFTAQDLGPITSPVHTLDRAHEPWWVPDQVGFFQSQSAQVAKLRGLLDQLKKDLLGKAQAEAGKQIESAKSQIAQAQAANADDGDILALQQSLDTTTRTAGAAQTIRDYRAVIQQGGAVLANATTVLDQAQQENQQVDQLAQQLVAQNNGNLGAIQHLGNDALSGARNDASVAAYMNKPSAFKGYEASRKAYNRLEKFAPLIANGDLGQAARGAAAAQRYGGQIHDALMGNLPSHIVIVSFQAQHMWAYENNKTVLDTLVTTGVRGVTDYGTDFGPMKVLYKEHPHKMHSSWPKGSQYWYPDTVVQWTTFFTWTGESIHDAAWQPDSTLGPGSQYNPNLRSHGCIHIPADLAQWMYNWAPVGMPVIVYPGDGSTVANQLSLITTDDQGTPKSA